MGNSEHAVANQDDADSEQGEATEHPSADEAANSDHGPVFISRVAACVVRLPADADPMFTTPEAREYAEKVQESLEKELEADPRVVELFTPTAQPFDNATTDTYWAVHPDAEKLTDAFEQYEGLRFNRPTVFRVRVPGKNQPRYRSLDDVPADEYLVAWSGQGVVVQWEQDSPRSTGSGGHVVLALLEEVGQKAGIQIEVIPCATNCHHRFIHADFVSFSGSHDHDQYEARGTARVGRTVETPHGMLDSALANLQQTFRAVSSPLAAYGQAKTLANLVLYLEWRARGDSAAVLAIAYERASLSTWRRPLRRLRGSWELLGTRRESRELMAGLWLALVTIDAQRGSWRITNHRLLEVLERSRMPLLISEFDVNREAIEALDVSVLRDSTSELGARLEGRQLFFATSIGAVAALAGAAIAVLLT